MCVCACEFRRNSQREGTPERQTGTRETQTQRVYYRDIERCESNLGIPPSFGHGGCRRLLRLVSAAFGQGKGNGSVCGRGGVTRVVVRTCRTRDNSAQKNFILKDTLQQRTPTSKEMQSRKTHTDTSTYYSLHLSQSGFGKIRHW